MKLNVLHMLCTPGAKPAVPTPHVEVAAPHGVSPNALDAILESLQALNRRQTRIETRLVRLMKEQGLDASGEPSGTQ